MICPCTCPPTYLRYVNRNHDHPLYGKVGVKLAQGVGPGPRNVAVLLDGAGCVIAPYGNWRKYTPETKQGRLV